MPTRHSFRCGFLSRIFLLVWSSLIGSSAVAQGSSNLSRPGSVVEASTVAKVSTVEDYDRQLPLWGTAWGDGGSSIGGFYPSFYTGFAMRSQYPERIHVRQARGNQLRVTVILDDQTISNYAFDLVARDEFYRAMTSAGLINVNPQGAAIIPHQKYFSQIIESPYYGIRPFIQSARENPQWDETLYAKNLELLTALNPGRVFHLKINLKSEFLKWKQTLQNILGSTDPGLADNKSKALIAINSLVWGRINLTEEPSPDVLRKLKTSLRLINSEDETQFLISARDLFLSVVGRKFDFRVQDTNGRMISPFQCQDVHACFLAYPEFTAIYPMGSVKAFAKDQWGNSIPSLASPGLWKFIDSNSSRVVDNIRREGYYGWIPKMDYEVIGNGYHNPAVVFKNMGQGVKTALGILMEHNRYWAVMRGGVSHGCSRLPAGHIWELRHILPVENSKMTQVHAFNHHALDFDLYDIDGDGEIEVMGVEYLISYDLAGAGDVARREGKDLQISAGKKLEFYNKLYGSRNVFEQDPSGELVFVNPGVSMPSHLDFNKKSISSRLSLKGRYRLYEAPYEKDKIQFYTTRSGSPDRNIVRLMGRVRGCSPQANKTECGEASFERERSDLAKGTMR